MPETWENTLVGQNKKWMVMSLPSLFHRVSLSLGHAIADKQTKELTFKHRTFPDHNFSAQRASQQPLPLGTTSYQRLGSKL